MNRICFLSEKEILIDNWEPLAKKLAHLVEGHTSFHTFDENFCSQINKSNLNDDEIHRTYAIFNSLSVNAGREQKNVFELSCLDDLTCI